MFKVFRDTEKQGQVHFRKIGKKESFLQVFEQSWFIIRQKKEVFTTGSPRSIKINKLINNWLYINYQLDALTIIYS